MIVLVIDFVIDFPNMYMDRDSSVLVLVNLLLYFPNMYMDRDSSVLVIDFVNDCFVIVIDFVIAIMEKYLELEKRTCVRRRAGLRAHTGLIFFLFVKNQLIPVG
jgi:hypothetical protein